MVYLPMLIWELMIWELMIGELNLRSTRECISYAINIIVVVCLTISSALRSGRYLEYRLRLVHPDQEQYYETKEARIIKDRLSKYNLKAIFDIIDTTASPDPGTEDANNRRNTIKPLHLWLYTTEIYAKATLVTHAYVRTNRKGLVPWLSSLSMLHKLFAGDDDS